MQSFSYKSTEELSQVTLKSDSKFKENLTCGFKYDMKNLVNFHPSTKKSKNFTSMGYFCVMTLKGVAKFKIKLTCGLKNDIRS